MAKKKTVTKKKPVKKIVFDLFRYQILPKDRHIQRDFFGEVKSIDELLRCKNEIFMRVLMAVKDFKTHRSIIKHKVMYHDSDGTLFRFAANRSLTIETEEFTEEEVANWPSIYVFIWNSPDKQIIAVQERWNAFQDTGTVTKAIINAVDSELGENNLRAHVEPLFSENVFWDMMDLHKGKIKDITFELITPNMSNISGELGDDLRQFAKGTNTAKTKLDIIADPDSSLLVEKTDPQVSSLVKYSSEGGGNISVKIRGVSRRIHTNKSRKCIDIEELEITGGDGKKIATILRDLLI